MKASLSYVMLFRHRGEIQLYVPESCWSLGHACRHLKLAVQHAKAGNYSSMMKNWYACSAYLLALHELTSWFPTPNFEMMHIENLLFDLLDCNR